MNNGFITLHRKITEWEWYQDPNTFRLFIHLLLKANHAEMKWQGQVINRGQLITGRIKLSEELKISERSIRTSLDKLKKTKIITIKPTNRFSFITIINYSSYQDIDSKTTSKKSNKRPATDQLPTTNNNVNHDNNVNNKNIDQSDLDFCFDGFWKSGIRKVNKKKAIPIFEKYLADNHDPTGPTIFDLTTALVNDVKQRLKSNQLGFSEMHPTTYLNGERWEDEIKDNTHEENKRISTASNKRSNFTNLMVSYKDRIQAAEE